MAVRVPHALRLHRAELPLSWKEDPSQKLIDDCLSFAHVLIRVYVDRRNYNERARFLRQYSPSVKVNAQVRSSQVESVATWLLQTFRKRRDERQLNSSRDSWILLVPREDQKSLICVAQCYRSRIP